MLPIAEFCAGEQAYLFVRGPALGHMDARWQGNEEAQRFLTGDMEAELAARGIEVMVPES